MLFNFALGKLAKGDLLILYGIYWWVSNFLIKSLFLAAAFLPSCNISWLAHPDLNINLPIVNFSCLSFPEPNSWLLVGLVLLQVYALIDMPVLKPSKRKHKASQAPILETLDKGRKIRQSCPGGFARHYCNFLVPPCGSRSVHQATLSMLQEN